MERQALSILTGKWGQTGEKTGSIYERARGTVDEHAPLNQRPTHAHPTNIDNKRQIICLTFVIAGSILATVLRRTGRRHMSLGSGRDRVREAKASKPRRNLSEQWQRTSRW